MSSFFSLELMHYLREKKKLRAISEFFPYNEMHIRRHTEDDDDEGIAFSSLFVAPCLPTSSASSSSPPSSSSCRKRTEIWEASEKKTDCEGGDDDKKLTQNEAERTVGKRWSTLKNSDSSMDGSLCRWVDGSICRRIDGSEKHRREEKRRGVGRRNTENLNLKKKKKKKKRERSFSLFPKMPFCHQHHPNLCWWMFTVHSHSRCGLHSYRIYIHIGTHTPYIVFMYLYM